MKIDRLQGLDVKGAPQQKGDVPVTSSAPMDSVLLGGPGAPPASAAQIRRLFEPGVTPEAHVIWKTPVDDMRKNPRGGGFLPAEPVVATDGSFVVGTHRGEAIACGPDGQVRWKRDLGGISANNEPAAGWDGSMLFTNEHDRRLVCLNPDGAPRYEALLPEPAHTRPAVDVDGRVVVSGAKQLHSVGPDGAVQWSSDLPALYCGFLTRPDHSVLVYGTGAGLKDPVVLQCVGDKGEELWRHTLEGRPGGLPANGPSGETVVTDGTFVRVLDGKGNVAALVDLGSPAGEPLVDPQGRLYVGTEDGRLVAMDLNALQAPPRKSSGKAAPPSKNKAPSPLPQLWTAQLPGKVKGHLTLGPEGELYCLNGSGQLTCVSADGGTQWNAPLGSYSNVSVTVAPDRTTFVLLDCRRLKVFDGRGIPTGAMEREYLSMASSAPSPGAVTVADFDSVYLVTPGSLEDVLKAPPPAPGRPPGSIERVGDWVIVDGVRVPIRKQPL